MSNGIGTAPVKHASMKQRHTIRWGEALRSTAGMALLFTMDDLIWASNEAQRFVTVVWFFVISVGGAALLRLKLRVELSEEGLGNPGGDNLQWDEITEVDINRQWGLYQGIKARGPNGRVFVPQGIARSVSFCDAIRARLPDYHPLRRVVDSASDSP